MIKELLWKIPSVVVVSWGLLWCVENLTRNKLRSFLHDCLMVFLLVGIVPVYLVLVLAASPLMVLFSYMGLDLRKDDPRRVRL
jgi:hypothetical protein